MRSTIAALVCLFGGLFAIYGLSYSGAFTADDEHLFVSGAQSLAQWGRFEAPQVYGNSRMQVEWRDVEPLQPLLGAALVQLADVLDLGRVQTLFILNSIVTALTACVVFLVVRVRASLRTALIVAIFYGLGTMAWPYAKTYYRDPLAALMLALAYLGYALAREPVWRKPGLWLMVLGLLGGLLAKSTIAVAIIAFPLAAMIELPHERWSWPNLRVPLAAATSLVLLAWLVSVFLPASGPLNRLSWSYLTSLAQYFALAPHAAFGEAVLGSFISPGKGLFIYSVPLLLAPLAFVFDKTHWRSWILPWLIALGLAVAQALFYDSAWWGGVNWGPRFLLPAIPLLAVACAPAVETLRARWRWVLLVVIGLGGWVQIGGALVNARDYIGLLYTLDPDNIYQLAVWQMSTSPVMGHWQFLMQGMGLDLAWVRLAPLNSLAVSGVVAGWGVLLTVAGYGLYRNWVGQDAKIPVVVSVMLILCLPVVMLKTYNPDPLYFETRTVYGTSLQYVSEQVRDGDVVVVQSYGAPLWHYFLNNARLPVRWYSLPPHVPTQAELDAYTATGQALGLLDPVAVELLETLSKSYCRIWLANSPDAAPDSYESAHVWLAAQWTPEAENEFQELSNTVHVSVFRTRSSCVQDI